MSAWLGTWRNQFGSTIEITVDDRGRIEGVFRTALTDSGFHGQDVPLFGAAHGPVIGFTSAAAGPVASAAVSYTGLLRDGKLQTMWHMVADQALTAGRAGDVAAVIELPAWRAFTTNLDTFERVG